MSLQSCKTILITSWETEVDPFLKMIPANKNTFQNFFVNS